MNFSLVVMLSLPVLYLTGSLKKSVSAMRISGKAFVTYFLIAAALSVLPVISIFPGFSISLAGTFVCVAPAIYLALRKNSGFRFLLAVLLSVLLAVSAFYVFSSLTLPYLEPLTGLAVSFLALACLGQGAAPRAPVLAGVYGMSQSIMALLTGQLRVLRLFDVTELAVLCFLFCFAISGFAALFQRKPAKTLDTAFHRFSKPECPQPEDPKPINPEPEYPEPDFPGTEFPKPEFPEPEIPKPEIDEPVLPEIEFPKPAPISSPLPRSRHNEG